jgi:succinate dehydrogenase / fumarate reductase membrane anchor subunit
MTTPQHIKAIATPTTHYGSGKASTRSFVTQRVTGALNAVFTLFFVWLVVRLAGASAAGMGDLISNPIVAVVVALMIISVTMHMRIGMREVIEDYVHDEKLNRLCVLLNTLFAVLVALITLIALAKLAFWG